jgi:hypothetical protein
MESTVYFSEIHPKVSPLQSVLSYQKIDCGRVHYGLFSGYDVESESIKFCQRGRDLFVPLKEMVTLEIVNPLHIQMICLSLRLVQGIFSEEDLRLSAVVALNQLG